MVDFALAIEFEFLPLKLVIHFIIPNLLLIPGLSFLLLEYKLFFEKGSRLHLLHQMGRSICFSGEFVHFCLSDQGFLADDSLGICRNLLSFLSALLPELSLKISEQRPRGYLHILNFTSFKPDSPTMKDFLHFFFDSISEFTSVLEDIVEGQVCDSISDDGDNHLLKFVVALDSCLLFEIISESLVGSEWTLTFSMNAPDEHA